MASARMSGLRASEQGPHRWLIRYLAGQDGGGGQEGVPTRMSDTAAAAPSNVTVHRHSDSPSGPTVNALWLATSGTIVTEAGTPA